jgi:hypothetical protein
MPEQRLQDLVKGPKQPTPLSFPSLVSATELLNRKVEQIPCLADPILPKSGVVCLAGPSDSGKSSCLRQLCLDVVNNEERFLGFPLRPIHNRGIYVSSEDDETAMSFLLNKQSKGRNYNPDNCKGLTFIFDTTDVLGQLEYHLQQQPVDLIVIDAFADLFGKGSLNDSNSVRNFIHPFSQLAQRYECLVIFLHHTGKRSEEGEPSKHNLLGSQGFEAKMRLVIELRTDFLEPDKRHMCIVKGNYLPAEYKRESFVLRFDENMLFYNTGQRAGFESLVKIQGVKPEQVDKFAKAKELKDQGHTLDQIATQLGYSNKGAVSKLLNTSIVSKVVSKETPQETISKEGFPVSPSLGLGNEETPF